MDAFDLGRFRVGNRAPCRIIAEAGVNHNGDLDTGLALVDAACRAGADAVKFQTFTADRLALPGTAKCGYQIRRTGADQSQYEMLKGLELSRAFHQALMDHCRRRGILFLSSPFDEGSADLLADLGVCALKIPSGEITNLPFLRHVAGIDRPLVLSTGMAEFEEVAAAVEAVRAVRGGTLAPGLALLHCLSSYPAPPEEANLRAMATLRRAFGVPVGFSDHTPGIEVALAAVALGADLLEKHFTLDRNLPGPDHQASLEPGELADMVRAVRVVEASLGDGRKCRRPCEGEVARAVRKSVTSRRAIAKGSVLEPSMFLMRRPGTGFPPAFADRLCGRVAARDIPEGALITPDDVLPPCDA